VKNRIQNLSITLTLLALSTLNFQHSTAFAQGTTFTYQGRLNNGGSPASGNYDLSFALFGTNAGSIAIAGPVTNTATGVSNGLFTATIDFGPGVFNGGNYWLEVAVRTNGGSGFTTLSPRQPVTPTPYTIFANTASNLTGALPSAQLSGTLPSAQLSGTYSGAVTFNNAGNSFTGNGGGLANVNAMTLGGLGAANFWNTAGNAGTSPGVNFLGTIDNQPLELRVNGSRALRLEPGGVAADAFNNIPTGAPNAIGGSMVNFVEPGVVGAVIAGGGATNFFGTPYTNSVAADFGTIGGGLNNTIQIYSMYSTIGGGGQNTIQNGVHSSVIGGGGGNTIQATTSGSTIGGGLNNTIQTYADDSTISGGKQNMIQSQAEYSTVGGGYVNTIQTNAWSSTIGGGDNNTIQSGALYSTIAGGQSNVVSSSYGFAAGYNARAANSGAFVWSDGTGTTTASTANNQFVARGSGGFVFYTGTGSGGAQLPAGGTSWATISDQNEKKNFNPVNGQEILNKLATVSVEKWNYKWEKDSDVPNIGPMAQAFKAAFYPGRDDKSITTLEFDGVELAAIQGLNEKVEVKSQKSEGQIEELKAENAELKERIDKLEQLLNDKLNGGVK
jgi:hypothetical protein